MKPTTLCIIILAAGCFLMLAPQVRAQNVFAQTSVDFDEQAGVIYGSASVLTDYDVVNYYHVGLSAYLQNGDGTAGAFGSAYNIGDDPSADITLLLEAEADTDYTIQADFQVSTKYRRPEIGYYYWDDYYYFSYFEGQGIDAPDWYDFFAPGGLPIGISHPNVNMGKTHGHKKVGRPDRLVVMDDYTQKLDCYGGVNNGAKYRFITYKVVDSSGAPVGRVHLTEIAGILPSSTCSGGQVQTTNNCSEVSYQDSTFQDNISAGCKLNQNTGDDCGYTFLNRWAWCPSGRAPVVLATLLHDVHYGWIQINGQENLRGWSIYP